MRKLSLPLFMATVPNLVFAQPPVDKFEIAGKLSVKLHELLK